MDKRFALVLGIVIAVFIGIFVLSGGKQSAGDATFEGDPTQVQADDWAEGPRDAKVVLMEYGDFQCPGCATLFPALEQVKSELGDQFLFVYRHFPLTNIHPNAMAAHRAAEAAGKQGQFFGMHDLLFARQSQWSNASNASAIFESFAQELQLDLDQFKTDVASQEVFDRISQHLDSGNQLDISSTPTLFLNGAKIDNPATLDELKQIIQDAIDQAKAE